MSVILFVQYDGTDGWTPEPKEENDEKKSKTKEESKKG